MGPLILGPALSGHDVLAAMMVWIATLVASATTCAMNSFNLFVCLLFFLCLTVILYFVFESASMRLPFCHLFLPRLFTLCVNEVYLE